MPQYGEFVYGGGMYGATVEGYRVYVKLGSPPSPGVDAPFTTASDLVNALELGVVSLGLVAGSNYFGAVTAYNAFGESAAIAEFAFRTDGSALPMLVPSPVRNLRAVAMAGGAVRIEWDYWEANAIGVVADDFLILGSTMPLPPYAPGEIYDFDVIEVVPHLQPRRHYVQIINYEFMVADSELKLYFRVLSRRAELWEQYVKDVIVVADWLPPEAIDLGMEAA